MIYLREKSVYILFINKNNSNNESQDTRMKLDMGVMVNMNDNRYQFIENSVGKGIE